jgi:hypothetical protein
MTMVTNIYKKALSSLWIAVLGLAGAGLADVSAQAFVNTPQTQASFVQPANDPAMLDAKRLNALGMIETGNNDQAIGSAGEISRYQLSPPVWRSYSRSMDYENPGLALQVARQHWSFLAAYFKEKTGRTPSDFDMYVLWNTRYGYYARKGFSKQQLCAVVQDRAQRFVNLVNRR